MSVIEISDTSFKSDVEVEDSGVVLVDFWAPWCGPCKMLAPVLDEVGKELEGKVKVAKLNVDSNPDSAGKYGVMGIPTLMVFKDGKMQSKLVGNQTKEQLVEWLEEYL